jgi:chemotaxis protein MotB
MLSRKTVEEDIPLWSMVDLMTLLLVFFLFLYSLSAKKTYLKTNSPNIDRPAIEIKTPTPSLQPLKDESSAESDKALIKPAFTTNKNSNLNKAINQLRTDVLNVVEVKDKDVFSIRREENRLVFVLGERITFREGEASLLEAYHSISKKIAGFISSKKGYQVVISGHTDNTPINTDKFPSNLELSAARAINVANSLINNGVSPERVSIQGFSEYRPLFDNISPENRQANRRVEISLINEQTPEH